jgi:arylsulfatase A-like enzyme
MNRILPKLLCLIAAAALSACGSTPPAATPERPNIVLITLDTTRPDRLGCYGYPKDTTPNLDSFAAGSVVHRAAYATSSWTLPSHASLFTGRFGSSHGARYDMNGPVKITSAIDGPKLWDLYRARGLGTSAPTLAELLAEAEYRTGAVVSGPWMKAVFGLARGFHDYDESGISTVAGRLAADVTDAASEWITEHADRRFFLFLNYYDPHAPYDAPLPYGARYVDPAVAEDPAREMELDSGLYDGEIAYMDAHLGRLFAKLAELELDTNTWIIVTADHGELLGEKGIQGHGSYLTEEELRIPLIIRWPGGRNGGTVDDDRVQLVDLFRMILDEVGIATPADIQGSPPGRLEHPMIAEVYPLPYRSEAGEWRAWYQGPLKYLWNSKGNHELYDLSVDPWTVQNLYDERKDQADRLGSALDHYLESLPKPAAEDVEDVELDAETLEALKSLGYTN